MNNTDKEIDLMKFKVKKDTAYLLQDCSVVICTSILPCGLKVFERNCGEIPFVVSNLNYIEAVAKIEV